MNTLQKIKKHGVTLTKQFESGVLYNCARTSILISIYGAVWIDGIETTRYYAWRIRRAIRKSAR